MNTPAKASSGSRLSAEESLRTLARSLAPYMAEELRRLESLRGQELDPAYDDRTCDRFVVDLSDGVLARAATLFETLDRDRLVDSVDLASALGVSPRALSGNLTTPIKRRSKALQLPVPFEGGQGDQPYGGISSPSPSLDPQRTHWRDRDGIAARMLVAIEREQTRRSSGAAAANPKPVGG